MRLSDHLLIRCACFGLTIAISLSFAAIGAVAQDELLEPPPEDPTASVRRQVSNDQAIEIFQSRLQKNPQDTGNRIKLGLAYLRRARETGDLKNYDLAEAEFQRVLEISPENAAATSYIATVFMAQHKFRKALDLSEQVLKQNRHSKHALATVGDAHLELGNYDQAEAAYAKLQKATLTPVPEVLARRARLAELRGETSQAIRLLTEARNEQASGDPNAGDLAWYDLRLGELYFGCNEIDKAEKHLEAALKRRENDVPTLLALGRLRAAQQRFNDAVSLYQRAVSIQGDFDLIGDLATLHGLAGDQQQAEQLEQKARAMVPDAAKVETEARHLALFLADRGLQLDLALAAARKELKVREDIYAYDVLAWVLHQRGEHEEAEEAMRSALRLGTKDARLHFHAGMIAKANGDKDKAREHLQAALNINPHFSLTQVSVARETLAGLK